MKSSDRHVMIFGGGILQQSLILQCKRLGLKTVVVDPDSNAFAREDADIFHVVSGNDFFRTCEIIETFDVQGIITCATDKPLQMMARIAEKYNFPFFSKKTAEACTDKWKMKRVFAQHEITHARGQLISRGQAPDFFPAIVKPVDNSGSRGVFYCSTRMAARKQVMEAFQHTKETSIIVEEYIEGQEYSVESTHFNGKTRVIQITEKITSDQPENVELAHIAPAVLPDSTRINIERLIEKIASAFAFNECAAHTELKVNGDLITVIETSPRLGGDFITSKLVPKATGINMEVQLILNAIGDNIVENHSSEKRGVSGIFFHQLQVGKTIHSIPTLESIQEIAPFIEFTFDLAIGDRIPKIKNSLDRYGYVILQSETRKELLHKSSEIHNLLNQINRKKENN